MKQRIIIFSTAYLPLIGGAEVAIKEITDRLYDYDFDLVTARLNRKFPASERIGNVQVYRVGIGVPFIDKLVLTFFGCHRAKKLHLQNKYNGVWAVMASYGGFAASHFANCVKAPLLLTLQEGDPLESIESKVRFVKKYFYQIFRRAKILQAISFFLLDWGKKMGFSGDYAVVVPNGVDISRFSRHYSVEEIKYNKEKYALPEGSKLFITVSRLVEKNGVDTVIESLSYLPNVYHLVICGSGPLDKKLKSLAELKKVFDRVHFLGDISHEKLPLVLKTSEVFVRASRSEGLGNAFLEAMGAGLITIGTSVGGIPDFLRDGETGFLTEPNNPTHLAKTIERAFALNTHERHLIHERALNLVKRSYNWDTIAEEMKTLFIRLCNPNKSV